MESENTNLSSRKSNSPDSRTNEDKSSSEEYETDSSSNSGSEEHEAGTSRSNYYQEKILRNKREQQEILKLIQLSEAKEDFTTALNKIKPKKKTLNPKEKKIYEGPVRQSDRNKDRKRKNLSLKSLFARAYNVKTDEKVNLLADFLIPALNHKTYGDLLIWDPLHPSCFLLKNENMRSSSWSPEQSAVFTAWDKIKGRKEPKSRLDYYSSKKRMTSALYKQKNLKLLKSVGRYYRLKVSNSDTYEVKQEFEFNCPTNGDKNIPLALKVEMEAEKRKRRLQRKGKDIEWNSSDEEELDSSDEEEDMVYEPYVLAAIDSKKSLKSTLSDANQRRSSRLKDTKVNYSIDDLFNRMYGAPETEQSQTEENKMTVARFKASAEKFHPNGTEFSEWPKVLLHRLPQTVISKYCDDVDVKQKI